VQNRVQAVVLGGLEVTGSLWEKLLGFSSTQIGNNSQAVGSILTFEANSQYYFSLRF
jgi:hypothetical protein